MLVSCFKSSRPRPRLYPHHHLYSQILRKVTNYYWEQIWAPSRDLWNSALIVTRHSTWLQWRDFTKDSASGGKDKARSEEEVKPVCSAELSFVAGLFPNEDLSSLVMNHCCQWSYDDVCLIIWPNAIGIQILPPPPAARPRIIEMLSNWSPAICDSNIFRHYHRWDRHHSSLYCSAQSWPNIGNSQIVKSHKSCSRS